MCLHTWIIYQTVWWGVPRARRDPLSMLPPFDWSASFYLRVNLWVNAFLTILSLNGAYCYFFVTEKTGREIETKTRRVTYSTGTIYFPKLSGRQRSYMEELGDVSSSQEKCKMPLSLRYSYCEVCRMYHYYSCNSLRPTSKNNQEFCNHVGCVHTLRSKSVTKPKAEVDSKFNTGEPLRSRARLSKVPIAIRARKPVLFLLCLHSR